VTPRRRIIDVPRSWLTKIDDRGRAVKKARGRAKPLRASLTEHDYRLVLSGQIVARQERDST
jgi:hypothetical protein